MPRTFDRERHLSVDVGVDGVSGSHSEAPSTSTKAWDFSRVSTLLTFQKKDTTVHRYHTYTTAHAFFPIVKDNWVVCIERGGWMMQAMDRAHTLRSRMHSSGVTNHAKSVPTQTALHRHYSSNSDTRAYNPHLGAVVVPSWPYADPGEGVARRQATPLVCFGA